MIRRGAWSGLSLKDVPTACHVEDTQGRLRLEASSWGGGWGREAKDISYVDMGWGRRCLAWRQGGGLLPWDGTQEEG